MPDKPRTVIILAGGRGSRLGSLTEETPKPLVKVQGRPLLSYGVGFAHALGASRIIISAGHMAEKLDEARKEFTIDTTLVTDAIAEPGRRILGILAARDFVEGDLIVFDADYIFHQEVASALRNNMSTDVTVHTADRKSIWMTQDVVARFTDQFRLVDLVKTEGTKETLEGNELYFNSLFYCPQQNLEDFFNSASHTAFIEKGDHLEDAVQAYNRDAIVRVRNLGRPLWVEVDTPAELDAAQQFVAAYSGAIPHA